MPLFGSNAPQGGQLMGPPPPTATSQVAEQTGATASSPFLQYLQQNAPAARETAQALMGDKPEADYGDAWLQAGLAMMSQGGGQTFLQALGNAGQTAMPLIQQEKQRLQAHEQGVKNLATQLNMSAAEFEAKMKERKGLKELGGHVIDEGQYEDDLKAGIDPETAFKSASIIDPSRAAEDNAKAYARTKKRLRILQNDPDADPDEIQVAMDELEHWESQMQGETPTQTLTVQDEDGRWTTVTGPADQIASTMNVVGDQKEAKVLREKFEATDQVFDYGTQIFKIMDDAESKNVYGKLGGLASSTAVWTDAIMGNLSGGRKEQFQSEVGEDPMGYVDRMRNDPEARALVGDGFIESLREMGTQNTAMLSNVIGLGYATARAEEPGGRLATSDVALALSSSGYDMDALLNDPAAVREGVTRLLRRNVADYERSLLARKNGEELLKNDYFLTKRLPQYGFKWTGGPNGRLIYVGDKESQTSEGGQQGQERQQAPAPGPSPQPQPQKQGGPQKPISQMTLEDLTSVDRTKMTDEELKEAARRYNELSQGAQ